MSLLGPSWGPYLEPLWALLGPSWAILGRLGQKPQEKGPFRPQVYKKTGKTPFSTPPSCHPPRPLASVAPRPGFPPNPSSQLRFAAPFASSLRKLPAAADCVSWAASRHLSSMKTGSEEKRRKKSADWMAMHGSLPSFVSSWGCLGPSRYISCHHCSIFVYFAWCVALHFVLALF